MALAKDELARRMRSAWERSGMTLAQVGERIPNADGHPTDWRVVQRWMSGTSTPRPAKINQLADVLGVERDHFQEPQIEHIHDRLERKIEENARYLRTTLGLLDRVLGDLREHDARVQKLIDEQSTALTGRIEELEARTSRLSDAQREFLQALGANARPPATNGPGRASTPRSKKKTGTQPEDG